MTGETPFDPEEILDRLERDEDALSEIAGAVAEYRAQGWHGVSDLKRLVFVVTRLLKGSPAAGPPDVMALREYIRSTGSRSGRTDGDPGGAG